LQASIVICKFGVRHAEHFSCRYGSKDRTAGQPSPKWIIWLPLADAERILASCEDRTLEKQRFFVEDAGAMWHVDVYCSLLQGTVVAEVELKDESQGLTLPAWVGKEVTGDPLYRKINMRARALKRASAAAACIQSAPG
jgi:CYTH domain-containing protein